MSLLSSGPRPTWGETHPGGTKRPETGTTVSGAVGFGGSVTTRSETKVSLGYSAGAGPATTCVEDVVTARDGCVWVPSRVRGGVCWIPVVGVREVWGRPSVLWDTEPEVSTPRVSRVTTLVSRSPHTSSTAEFGPLGLPLEGGSRRHRSREWDGWCAPRRGDRRLRHPSTGSWKERRGDPDSGIPVHSPVPSMDQATPVSSVKTVVTTFRTGCGRRRGTSV